MPALIPTRGGSCGASLCANSSAIAACIHWRESSISLCRSPTWLASAISRHSRANALNSSARDESTIFPADNKPNVPSGNRVPVHPSETARSALIAILRKRSGPPQRPGMTDHWREQAQRSLVNRHGPMPCEPASGMQGVCCAPTNGEHANGLRVHLVATQALEFGHRASEAAARWC